MKIYNPPIIQVNLTKLGLEPEKFGRTANRKYKKSKRSPESNEARARHQAKDIEWQLRSRPDAYLPSFASSRANRFKLNTRAITTMTPMPKKAGSIRALMKRYIRRPWKASKIFELK